ncbi:alpha-L RNA-binding motif-containing protein [Pholiota conissans]|uniref:Alpha-L RNA-binding motif-containing protein n=1 Tax=Pholiota conissans TaxID=109636 RepID=A0A9P5Z1R2_9AGAR|nr:alpha-L RNA-binding motif-containing protein [Pholiota conissans]
MRNKNVLNLRRSLPCMVRQIRDSTCFARFSTDGILWLLVILKLCSWREQSWSPKNLYNLWKRTVGPKASELTFKLTTEQTVFQQRWRSKAAVRAYHGDFIPEKVFKRWYLPQTIPDVRPRREVFSGGDKLDLEEFARRKLRAKQKEKDQEEEIEKKGMAPVGSLMFVEVERRLDVFLFRCCFVHSVYEARRLIIHGYVKLNGRKHNKANTRLAPGDMVTVDPDAIRFFKKPHGPYDNVNGTRLVETEAAEAVAVEEAATEAEAATETSTSSEGSIEASPETLETIEAQESSETSPETQEKPAEAAPVETKEAESTDVAPKADKKANLTPFYLPQYASPWLYIPAYIEVSFLACSAVYVRHPTARPGYSEIPTPYDADGALVRYAWEWYMQRRPRMRSQSQLARMPEDRVITVTQALHRDWARTIDPGWTLDPYHEKDAAGYEQRKRAREARKAKGRLIRESRLAQAAEAGEVRDAAPHLDAA